jgi:hypothetical protein
MYTDEQYSDGGDSATYRPLTVSSIDLTEELTANEMSDTEFTRKVLSYKHMRNKVQCLPIGKHDGITVYESFESAAARTFGR